MYLLEKIEHVPELKPKKVLTPKQLKEQEFQTKMTKLIEGRDSSAEASLGLNHRAEGFLRELKGKQVGLPYADHYYGKPVDGQMKLDMARAMVLGERRFVLFDRLALRVMEKIIDRDNTAPQVYFEDKKLISWRDFSEYYLTPFGKSTGTMDSESTEDPEPLHFALHGRKPIHLTLEKTAVGRVAMFQLRKGSIWRKYAVKLRDELNDALRDYLMRVDWMREYEAASARPGLNPEQLKAVKVALDPFYSVKRDFHELARGKFFEGSHMDLGVKSRAYAVRCNQCSFPLGVEIVSDYSFKQDVSWDSNGVTRERIEERRVNSVIGGFHRETGCSHEVGTSGRTGDTVVLEMSPALKANSRHIARNY